MKTITHTRGSLQTADAVADSIGALDEALRERDLVARLEIPVMSSGGVSTTVEVILGKRETLSTERSRARPIEDPDGGAFDQFDLDVP